MKKFFLTGAILLASFGTASAQCAGTFASGELCGNSGASDALAKRSTLSTFLDRAACGTNGSILGRSGGTWGCVATPLSVTLGGTGFASYAVGDILAANTTTSLSKIADVATGNALISGGVNTLPSWGKIGLTTHVSGTLPVGNGGTNVSSASGTAVDNISGFSSTGIMSRTGAGTYTFSTLSALLDVISSTRGAIIYRGASGWAALSPGTANFVLTSNGAGADPSYAAAGSGTVTSAVIAAGNGISVSGTCTITSTGTCTVTSTLTRHTQYFTASGTFTAPSGTNSTTVFTVTAVGGGAAGSNASVNNVTGPGGGAGCTGIRDFTGLSASTGYTVTIGAGGTGNGGAGGNTSFAGPSSVTLTAGGGPGGPTGCTSVTNGDTAIPGGDGASLVSSVGTSWIAGGHGGASSLGGGGTAAACANNCSTTSAAGTGKAYGSGGGGGSANTTGTVGPADGKGGWLKVEWVL